MGRAIPQPPLCACLTCNVTALPLCNLWGATHTFKMELAVFSEVSVSMYELIQHHIPEVLKLLHHWYENLKFCCWKHVTGSHWMSAEEQLSWSRHSFQCSVKVLHKQGSKSHHIYFWPRHLVVSCRFRYGLQIFALFSVLIGELLCKHDIGNYLTSIQSCELADSCLGSFVTANLRMLFIFCRMFGSDGDGNIIFFLILICLLFLLQQQIINTSSWKPL
jgi:hypothetical protein